MGTYFNDFDFCPYFLEICPEMTHFSDFFALWDRVFMSSHAQFPLVWDHVKNLSNIKFGTRNDALHRLFGAKLSHEFLTSLHGIHQELPVFPMHKRPEDFEDGISEIRQRRATQILCSAFESRG